jgi:hypothetical protein
VTAALQVPHVILSEDRHKKQTPTKQKHGNLFLGKLDSVGNQFGVASRDGVCLLVGVYEV